MNFDLKKQFIKERVIKFVFICMMLVSLVQTYELLKTHFTHVDDLGVAWTILNHDDSPDQECIQRFDASKDRWYSFISPFKKIVCHDLYGEISRINVVSSRWTYAPFQFWFTQELFKTKDRLSYEEVKLRGRLPSYFFFLTFLFCFYKLITKKIKSLSEGVYISLIIVSLACFSLESRIMSAQMHSYAIGLLSSTICLWVFLAISNIEDISAKKIICASIMLSLAIAMQYQAILLVISGILFIAFSWIRQQQSNQRLRIFLHFLLLIAFIFIITYVLVGDIRGMSKHGINWNAGPNKMFMVLGGNIFERVLSLLSLVGSNSAYNLYSILSPFQLNDFYANIFGMSASAVFLFGLSYLFKSKNPSDKKIFVLTAIYGVVYICFLYAGLLTYGPTRHLLFSLPIVLIILGFGLLQIHFYLQKFKLHPILPYIFALFFLASLMNFKSFQVQRFDPLSNALFDEVQAENHADFWLVGLHDIEWRFMPALDEKKIYVYQDSKCTKNSSLIRLNHNLTFIWYSKRTELNISESEFRKYIDSYVLSDCSARPKNSENFSVTYLASLKSKESNEEVDLSNKTKNGSNSYFIQKFRIDFK